MLILHVYFFILFQTIDPATNCLVSMNMIISIILLLLLQSPVPQSSSSSRTFYVAPNGSDEWSGTLAEPNASRTDGPFATLHGARDAVRQMTRADGGTTIIVRGGTYQLARSLVLNAADSGTENSPLVWRAQKGEQVILTGGRTIAGFHPVTDKSVLQRLDPAARSHVVVTNLKQQGITDFGVIAQRGSPGLEFFFNGKRMTLARWPNTGWLRIADVPQYGDSLYNKGLDRERRFNNVPVGRHYGRISYEGDRPRRWKDPSSVFLHGYWTWDWSDSFQRVKSIDTDRREITLAEPHHHYGYTKNQRYYYLNILEELDVPGEWYLDRSTGDLFFWPPSDMEQGSSVVSLLESPMAALDSTRFVTLRGFTFEQSRGEGVRITGGAHNVLAGCTFKQLGGEAVIVDGGSDNGVRSCDLYDLALAGIRLIGGDRKTLTPAHNFAVNNHIHDYSQWLRTGQYAVFLDGVGNRVAHNKIHNAPFEAMYLRGNDHIIEFNEIHNVCQETGDAGAIHTGRDWTWRGNVIRYNYFHDLKGPGLHGVMAAYLDDWASGFTIEGNVFYKAGRAAFIGGGRDNTVDNNIFVECTPSVHVDARGLGWASYYFDGSNTWLFDHLNAMNYRKPPYSVRYPRLLTLLNDQPRIPKGNVITHNVSYGGRWMDVYDYLAFDFFSVVTVKDNVIADPDILRRRKDGETGWDPYYLNIDRKEGYELFKAGDPEMVKEFKGNTFVKGNPGFKDLDNRNFQLKDDAPAYKKGFKRIPMEMIGLVTDEDRLTLPAGMKRPGW